ncbi:Retrovirus-related Pol polyprotein from transposon RE1 [Vitis vinifera]|uniref:Retrovirus-related Pol polyprotein from transposon RE1 n=1 Tax=Vitis vinifera TaxID=29760 RepID=A0A438C6I6_VITVI|nr:Retrovirus-related Pol polyprotein from transposon RE1 [Vitis vinifera]
MDHSLVVNFIRYPTAKQEEQVYTFLDGLDERLDHVRSDVLRLQSFPSIEQTYDYIRMKIFDNMSSSRSKGHSDGNKCTIVGVQNILGKPVSNCMATQTGGTNYKPERNEMLLNEDLHCQCQWATYLVTGAGTVPVSLSFSLAHTLLVPFISNKLMSAYFQQHGLLHETSCSQTPQQNGVAERKNWHILETSRVLLLGAMVSSFHWGDVVATAVYLINRIVRNIRLIQPMVTVGLNQIDQSSTRPLPEEKATGRERNFLASLDGTRRTSTTGRSVESAEPFFGSTPNFFQRKTF